MLDHSNRGPARLRALRNTPANGCPGFANPATHARYR